MIRTLRRRVAPMALASLAIHAGATFAFAQDGPGKSYAEIPAGAYSIVAEVRAMSGKEDELRAATLPLIELVRGDPKNLAYFLQENRAAPGHFIFYEIFANEADFEGPDMLYPLSIRRYPFSR